MLLALNKIETIINFLEQEVDKNKISDFKVFLKPNLEINVIVVSQNENYSLIALQHPAIKIEVISEEEKQHDPYYNQLFQDNSGKVELGFKRRFASFSNQQTKLEKHVKAPVVTFYSYKGGMGRSTTLVAYAMFCAIHEKKKVVILDCDFEAPGYLNFFNLSNNSRLLSGEVNGIVEYLLDADFEGENINLKENYTITVDNEYSGEGEIRIMPAGNLNEDRIVTHLRDFEGNTISTHKDHYIETLARLDTSRNESIINNFNKLLINIENQIKPDLILIDSRTGFNDIFGVTALHLSNCIVAFFGSSEQTKPGLKFLLDKYNKIKKYEPERNLNLILVNSILPKTNLKEHYTAFRSVIEKHLLDEQESEEQENVLPDMFFISRNEVLENLGVVTYDDNGNPDIAKMQLTEQNFITYIKNINRSKAGNDHIDLFKGITYKILPQKSKTTEIQSFPKLKRTIIENLVDLLGKEDGKIRLFAEEEPINPDLFFYRECMNEIIKEHRKFVISGFKGTGKTFLYKAFKNESIKNELIKRAKQESQNFIFIDIIEISRDENSFEYTKKYDFKNLALSSINDKWFYFQRLWLIYVWNSIMIESKKLLAYKSIASDLLKPMNASTETKLRFNKIITDDNLFLRIENDLRNLNSHLDVENINLIVLIDQLDKDVPHQGWRDIVSPLIKFWESIPYKRIIPKIFVRTDLFERLDLNNSQNIKKNNRVSIEWEREELYSYFLKLILAKSRDAFFAILQNSDVAENKLKAEINKISEIYNQVPLKRHLLEPLVSLVFGKEVRKGKIFLGNSYEYFFFTFKNANDTISIRPFINLMSYAVSSALSENSKPMYAKTMPLINVDFYLDSEAQNKAVGEHFNDLTSEGNRELEDIVRFLRDNTEYKQQYLTSTELEAFLNGVLDSYKLEGKTSKDLHDLLIATGIIAEHIKPDGRIYYFAMLYKYWLGLKNRKYQFGKAQQKSLYSGSDFEKIEAYFKNKLSIGGIYQKSLIGVTIYEATGGKGKGRKWAEVFDYPSYDEFLEALENKGIIELRDDGKFKLTHSLSLKVLNDL
jgi:cellulose biosynthesis protein BcsQ